MAFSEKKIQISYFYLIGEPLKDVILRSCIRITGVSDDLIDPRLQLFISRRIQKFLLETLPIKIDETLHALAFGHHHDQLQDLLLVLSQILHTEEEQQLKMPKNVRLRPLHQLHIISSQLEGRSLKVHISGWGREHEAKIYMYDMSINIDKDVVIVAILDIEVILDQRVSSKRLDEICQAGLPIQPEDLTIDVLQTSLMGHLFEKTDRSGIVNKLYQPWIARVRHDGVGPYPYLYVLFREDVVEERDQLHRHVFLP